MRRAAGSAARIPNAAPERSCVRPAISRCARSAVLLPGCCWPSSPSAGRPRRPCTASRTAWSARRCAPAHAADGHHVAGERGAAPPRDVRDARARTTSRARSARASSRRARRRGDDRAARTPHAASRPRRARPRREDTGAPRQRADGTGTTGARRLTRLAGRPARAGLSVDLLRRPVASPFMSIQTWFRAAVAAALLFLVLDVPRPHAQSLAGRVTDAATGEPLVGATVARARPLRRHHDRRRRAATRSRSAAPGPCAS